MKINHLWVGAVVLASLSQACDVRSGPGAGAPEGDSHPLVGVAAPDFELPAQSGASKVSLQDGAGKVMIVDFWATWCEPCKESFPHYQALVEKYGGQVVVVGISEDDDPSGIPGFAKETGAKFPLAWDESKTVSNAYNPPNMPTSYIIDKNGIVRFVHATFKSGSEQEIEAHVQSLLQ